MNNRIGWNEPEECLGCLIQLQVVADLVQPEGGSEGEGVGEDEGEEEADAEGRLIGVTDSKLLDTFLVWVKALGGEVGAVAFKSAEGQVSNVLIFPSVFAPEQDGMRVDVLQEAREGVDEPHDQDQDLRDQGADRGDQEAVGMVPDDGGQPKGIDGSLQEEKLSFFVFCP